LGSFLSGGIDSSVIASIAAQKVDKLQTFSIGYKDEPFYDETEYAELVAKKIGSNHTVFKLSNEDLFQNLHQTLNYIDEPFGDSSALVVNILSMHTKQKVTVALSGDGGDEIFAGYNKHKAEYTIQQLNGVAKFLLKNVSYLENLPQGRGSSFTNKIRQIVKFSQGLNLSKNERYIHWASFNQADWIEKLLLKGSESNYLKQLLPFTSHFEEKGITDVLLADMNLILQGDMLTKVDMMSMNHSLEVRVPFLDYRIVNFAFSLPDEFKINANIQKRILQDTYRSLMPDKLYNRSKKGFEVPLMKWFKTDLKRYIFDELLEDRFVESQNIFDLSSVKMFKNELQNGKSSDYQSLLWCLIVFQHWYKKNNLS
jgi:asparagine synthase (glutamine-hydrolysing)